MKLTIIASLLSIFLFGCSPTLVIEDLRPFYVSDASSDIQNITSARERNCQILSSLSAKKCSAQIKLFADKISRETDPAVRREYYRELEVYKHLYCDKFYENIRLSDIPIADRRSGDILDGTYKFVSFDSEQYIITDPTYILSGKCIASAVSLTVSANGKTVSEHRFSDSEQHIWSDSLSLGSDLIAGENVISVRIHRSRKEYYDYEKRILMIDGNVNVINAGNGCFNVKHTDKTEKYHHHLYEIDLSHAIKNQDRYTLSNGTHRIVFANEIDSDKLYMTVTVGKHRLTLYENNAAARNIMTVKWYDDNDLIIEYFTGEDNYTDYLLSHGDTIVRAGELMQLYELQYPILFTRTPDRYLLAHYGERSDPVRLYYFDSNIELQTIRKKTIDKNLHKQFTNDELLDSL